MTVPTTPIFCLGPRANVSTCQQVRRSYCCDATMARCIPACCASSHSTAAAWAFLVPGLFLNPITEKKTKKRHATFHEGEEAGFGAPRNQNQITRFARNQNQITHFPRNQNQIMGETWLFAKKPKNVASPETITKQGFLPETKTKSLIFPETKTNKNLLPPLCSTFGLCALNVVAMFVEIN